MNLRPRVLTPESLVMVDTIARTGSFAAAARELGKVPSALTYSVRQLEEALDVLLFDRSSRQAQFTPAGLELLSEGRRLLDQMDAVAHRVRRVATGWEAELTVAVDGVLSQVTVFELCEAFFALCDRSNTPGTRLRLRTEVLAGTWEALSSGQADLAVGVVTNMHTSPPPGVQVAVLGHMDFVFAVAPHHPLAQVEAPLGDADSARQVSPITVNLLPGQDVLTVSSMQAKVEAHVRCMGCGFLPEPVARRHIEAGRLVVKQVQRPRSKAEFGYAWRAHSNHDASLGLGLQWWLQQLSHQSTRQALLEKHAGPWP